MKCVIFVLILCSACLSISWAWLYPSIIPVLTTTKSWTRKTNQSWKNWNTRLGLGQINFPTNLEVPIAFPTETGMGCEIVIPMDDVANNEEFVLSPSEPACPKEAKTLLQDDVLWINPDNWAPTMTASVNPAVPHVERIPCRHDTIRFPSSLDDFIVILPNKNTSVQRMIYEGRMISNFNFKSILKKETFVKHFVVHGAYDVTELLTFTGRDCPEVTGCICGTMKFYPEICAIMTPKCNFTLPCTRPIKPVGHCCHMCGVYVEMTYDPQKFVMRKLYSVIFNKLINDQNNLQWYVSKISQGIVHLIITGDNEYEDRDIYPIVVDIIHDVVEIEHLGITSHTITSSGSIYDPKTWYSAIRTASYVLGSAVPLIFGYFLCTNKNTKIFMKKFPKFAKLYSTIEDDEAGEVMDIHSKEGSSVEATNGEAKSESDDVFVELRTGGESEDSQSPRSKEFEEVEILLDIPGIES